MKQIFFLTILLLLFSAVAMAQDYYPFENSQSQYQQRDLNNKDDQAHGFGSSWDNHTSFMKPYHHNTHGPGVHSDATGKPFEWKTRNGETSHSNKVNPDGYGLGGGMDEYGRPVKPSPFGN